MYMEIHAFEKAGLGKAPFTVKEYARETWKAAPDAPDQVGNSCRYCWTGIKDVFYIESADGKVFPVGSTCVNKTGDRGLINTVKRQMNQLKAEKAYKRNTERIANAVVELEDPELRKSLASHPHPLEWRASKGDTLLDWAEWMLANAGMSGKMQVVRVVNKEGGGK